MIPKLDCHTCRAIRDGIFGRLEPKVCACLSGSAVPHAYERGQAVFYEGTPSLAVYCIHSGMLRLTRQSDRGDVTVVGLKKPGDLCGHRAVLAGTPYGITAETVEPSVVCTISRECFRDLLQDTPGLAYHLLEQLAREFRDVEERLVERTSENVSRRTARLLLELSENGHNGGQTAEVTRIEARRADMAVLIGATPETLSRTLRALAAQGLIDVSRTHVGVRDRGGLRVLAGRRREREAHLET